MPELPEVESVVRAARPRLEGRRIVAFECFWPRQASPSVEAVRKGVVGKIVRRVWRRSKYIVCDLADHPAKPRKTQTDTAGHLLIHLRMSGRFEWPGRDSDSNAPLAHVRAMFDLHDGSRLAFCDARKFGRIVYTDRLDSVLGELGAEPLEPSFTPAVLARTLQSRNRRLKPLLLDQTAVAGLGNIYADEALHRARLHPLMIAARLRPPQIAALHEAIRHVLELGVKHNGASIDWAYPGGEMQQHFEVYGRDGEPCRTCGAIIRALRVGQRGTHVCPRCQPAPRSNALRSNASSSNASPSNASHSKASQMNTRRSRA